MIELDLIKDSGNMLDLGCGAGDDSEYFKKLGYKVISVDVRSEYRSAIRTDITNFHIEPEKYNVIICNNTLSFISDKEKVKKILANMSKGLALNGVMYFSLFGPHDEWMGNKNMSFFDLPEILPCIDSLNLSLIEKSVTEGYGKTMRGEVKFWHIIRFIFKRKD